MENDIITPLLNVNNLSITLCDTKKNYQQKLLSNVSFQLNRGQCLAIIGESGSGKTIMSKAIMGLNPDHFIVSGAIHFEHHNLLTIPDNHAAWNQIRGRKIALIPQNSINAFNPLLSIGYQIEETLKQHLSITKLQLLEQINHALQKVALPDYSQLAKKYPHEISGGMLQRITIALAFILKPDIIIADEPTSSIDWLTKKEVLEFFKHLLVDHQSALLLITHDFAEAKALSDYLLVLKQGEIVESGETQQILNNPIQFYTQTLINVRKTLDDVFQNNICNHRKHKVNSMLIVNKVDKRYAKKREWFTTQYQQVLHDISFEIKKGECLGIVGESGSGKSTLSRLILGLEKPDSGKIHFNTDNNQPIRISAVFQDYLSSVNPAMNVSQILLEPLSISKIRVTNQQKFILNLLNKVGLETNIYYKYPHELSGGQLQRLCIARALSIRPQFIVLDEPASSLDVINQLKILDLLKELKNKFELTYLFISHDLQAVSYLSDHIAFFYQGMIVEQVKMIDLAKVQSEHAKKMLLFAKNI